MGFDEEWKEIFEDHKRRSDEIDVAEDRYFSANPSKILDGPFEADRQRERSIFRQKQRAVLKKYGKISNNNPK